jgi:hypothetical protein
MLDLTPTTFLLLATAVLLTAYFARPSSSNIPTYGPAFLPPFVRGILAVVRLGEDEDGFLLSLKSYGPAVYIPWPMQQVRFPSLSLNSMPRLILGGTQYFVTDGEAIRAAYAAPTSVLSFVFCPFLLFFLFFPFSVLLPSFFRPDSELTRPSYSTPSVARCKVASSAPLSGKTFVSSKAVSSRSTPKE